MYTVKQVAEKMGISVHTLRFYDNEGLFPYVARGENNVRLFSDRDLEWVHLVQCMRETGMPLSEVKEYVRLALEGDATLARRQEMLIAQVEKAEAEREAMDKRINTLRWKVELYDGRIAAQREAAAESAATRKPVACVAAASMPTGAASAK